MYTVEAAAARGIPVGAVPGSIRSPTSEGTNGLLADGCFPVCGVDDILTALALRGVLLPGAAAGAAGAGPVVGPGSHAGADAVPGGGAAYTGTDRALFEALSSDPVSLDHLARVTGMELPALCGGLERLARVGVARDVGGWWERT